MNWLRQIFARRRIYGELSEEIRAHLDEKIEELVASGMPREEAEHAARRQFGNVLLAEQRSREVWQWPALENLLMDVRYAVRMLRKAPGFTAVAVITLALGIGANTAIFSLTNQVLLRSLPVPHPEQLVVLSSTEPRNGSIWADYNTKASFSYPMYKDLRDRSSVFSGLLACFPTDANVSWHGHADRAAGVLVSGNFFHVLGVGPALGRVFSQTDETTPGGNPVAVLSYGYWQGHFGGDPSILDQTLDVNGTALTVVGVAQEGFAGVQAGAAPDVYIPITMKPQMTPGWNGLHSISTYFLSIIGRLKPGVSQTRAQAALQPLFHATLESELPRQIATGMIVSPAAQEKFLSGTIELTPGARGRPVLQDSAETPLIFLTAIVGIVLLIACANLAGLLLARGEARQHEIALRMALGAGRTRLVRQLLAESVIVAAAGGAAGLLVGWWTLASLVAVSSRGTSLSGFVSGLTPNFDLRTLAFAAGATISSVTLFGLFPALRAARSDLHSSLKERGARASGGRGSVRLRKSLVVAQVALTAMLLVASGLFGESLIRLERTDLGMHIGHVDQFSLNPGLSNYSPAQAFALFTRLRHDAAAIPGVASAAVAEIPLLADSNSVDTMEFEGYVPGKGEDMTIWVNSVSPEFFSTLGIPLVRGRAFRESDSLSSPKVAIINDRVAEKFFRGRDPIGMHLAIGWGPKVHPNIEIVGIVADAKSVDPSSPIHPTVYFPYAQDSSLGGATFYVRTRADPTSMISSLREVAARDAPNVPIYDVRTLSDQLEYSPSMLGYRLVSFFTLSLALLAALLAAVGLYGVMAYVVVRRTQEIGIRIALGAMPGSVARLILRQAGLLVALGLSIGMVGALAAARLVRSLLYGVKAHDPAIFVLGALMLILVAFAACYFPARRAMRVDPMAALRNE